MQGLLVQDQDQDPDQVRVLMRLVKHPWWAQLLESMRPGAAPRLQWPREVHRRDCRFVCRMAAIRIRQPKVLDITEPSHSPPFLLMHRPAFLAMAFDIGRRVWGADSVPQFVPTVIRVGFRPLNKSALPPGLCFIRPDAET